MNRTPNTPLVSVGMPLYNSESWVADSIESILQASGNFGQVIRKNYPQLIATRVAAAPREVVTVVGPLCTPLDLLGDRVQLSRADVGDLVAVFQSGAYGLSASPTAFLSHPPPGEILV